MLHDTHQEPTVPARPGCRSPVLSQSECRSQEPPPLRPTHRLPATSALPAHPPLSSSLCVWGTTLLTFPYRLLLCQMPPVLALAACKRPCAQARVLRLRLSSSLAPVPKLQGAPHEDAPAAQSTPLLPSQAYKGPTSAHLSRHSSPPAALVTNALSFTVFHTFGIQATS